jgi:hypothetical protein
MGIKVDGANKKKIISCDRKHAAILDVSGHS